MKKLLCILLLVTAQSAAMDRKTDSNMTLKRAKKIQKALEDTCNPSLFDSFTRSWVPTSVFLSTSLYQSISSYRNNTFPSLGSIKDEIKATPKVFLVGSLFLVSCVAYTYYKPLFSSLYESLKDVYYGQKKTAGSEKGNVS